VPRSTAIRLLGVADRTFARLESEGVIRATTRGEGRRTSTYSACAVVAAYLAYRERKITGSLHNPHDRAYLAQAQAAEFKLAKERREYVPRGEFIELGQALAAALNAKIRALPNRLARRGVIMSASEPEALVAVNEMLAEIAAWRSAMDLHFATAETDTPTPPKGDRS
jgi:phage terminase Nu1 subunit (DNA packaging protein)